MRVLIVHNRYQQSGGEDAVVVTEAELLRNFGAEVGVFERSNAEIDSLPFWKKAEVLWNMHWSKDSYQKLRDRIREFQPDVVHFHNIFFILTPSVYWACRDENIPVVQSLHNFRLLCSNGLFFRDHHVCEECPQHKTLWRGVLHTCYKKSRLLSWLVVRMLEYHWEEKTWQTMVDRYITATEFGRQKYIAAGLPSEKIMVKPNIENTPSVTASTTSGAYALYAGRLSEEKGVEVLLDAWHLIPNLPLKIIGDGPLFEKLKNKIKKDGLINVELLGFVSKEKYTEYMNSAKFLVVPSVCYENFPKIVAEAYAYGIPVVASRLGSFPEFVIDGKTGILFETGSAEDLEKKVRWLLGHENELLKMKENIRQEYTARYSARKNYETLIEIYRQAIESRKN